MKIRYSDPFYRDYWKLPTNIQRALDKALKFLLENSFHPSLHAKKLPGTYVWYGRISRAYRFTFQYNDNGDTVILRRAGTHSILDQERRKS